MMNISTPQHQRNTYDYTFDTQRRWDILRRQMQHQQEPCFGSDSRYFCDERECSVRRECLELRARNLR